MKDIKSKIASVSYVSATELIPEDWSHWFWSSLAQGEITWGDTDHTLISAERFLLCFNEVIDECGEEDFTEQQVADIREVLIVLANDDVFIDLES